ncbi:amidase enhancer precursor [Clostridium homopropionicum DSM 5847]|uniref:Amidase enhancer n=1 Tax=Clostridium homopropionicum DSM 5847 TaxID=1121318 RepID=A0A0L6Z5V3_9CLOT|nr:stage II sporulation protein D [Clostridium homopropionicum]KOA18349.1 amidase enhancer precursor [Clostridium homopropionicum DSM 5847]SFF68665.1 stage II sporulation protein D [Clostridium homopropionicum]
MKKIFIGVFSLMLFITIISMLLVGLDGIKNNFNIINNKNKGDINENKLKKVYREEDLNIDVYISKEKRIVSMNIEDYVTGVVAAEMPAEFDIEALKAQAVAARTYGLAHTENFSENKNLKAFGADVNDTTEFQVFIYKDERMALWPKKKGEEYWEKILKAVEETKGEVITYNGSLVMAPYYFSTSSGRTEDAIDVFNKGQPYLKSVESSGEEKSPKYITKVKYTYSQLADIINSYNSKADLKGSTLRSNLRIVERSKAGSVMSLMIGKEYISGQKFRTQLNLNSANFTIEFNPNDITITCMGYGHGVGMSQWGANAMAKDGNTYKEILKHYYQGIELQKLVEK